MTRTLVFGAAACLFVAALASLPGCAMAAVVDEHVPGPHGEDMKAVQCNELMACYDAARKECNGEFDVKSSTVVPSEYGLQGILITCST